MFRVMMISPDNQRLIPSSAASMHRADFLVSRAVEKAVID